MRFVRYSILSVITLAAFAAGAYAQTFDLQNPFPATTALYGASSVGATVYVAGANGTILKSADGGSHWARLISSVYRSTDKLNAVSFFDINNGFVFGTGASNTPRVYKTTDGGGTFSSSSAGINGNTDLRAAAFSSNTYGWVVGKDMAANKGVVYGSNNGGTSWGAVTNGINPASANWEFNDVDFISDSVGGVIGRDNTNNGGMVYVTTNRGTSWGRRTSVNFTTGATFSSIGFQSATNIFIVGNDGSGVTAKGMMMQSFDQGLTWSRRSDGDIPSAKLYDIHFLPSNTQYGWAVGDSTDGSGNRWQVIIATTDGGSTWTRQDNGVLAGSLYVIRPGSTMAAWAVGFSMSQTSLVMNYMGSGIWYQQSRSLGAGSLNAISFYNRTNGYAIGTPYTGVPQLAKTQNAGFSWAANSLSGSVLNASGSKVTGIQFFNANTGWISGYTSANVGALSQSRDGGATWLAPNSYSPAMSAGNIFNAMKWQDVVVGYGVGTTSGGAPMVYYTTDAGADWVSSTAVSIPPAGASSGSLFCAATRPGIVYVGGFEKVGAFQNALLLMSTNTGTTWSRMSISATAPATVKGVFGQALDSVYACGQDANGGFILYTKNASQPIPQWFRGSITPATASSISSVNSVYFITPLIGYAVGVRLDNSAAVLRSLDGGLSWQEIDPSLPVTLNSMFVSFTNSADVWAVGSNETILHANVSLPLATFYPGTLFNNVARAIGDTAISYFAIGNSGTSPLVLNLSTIPTNWKLTFDSRVPSDYVLDSRLNPANATFTIPPGLLDSFMVVFKPNNVGPRGGTLNITSNSAKGDTVIVRMNATSGQASCNYNVTMTGNTAPLSMHNDTVLVGQFRDDSLFLTNPNGPSRLNVRSVRITGVNAGDYSLVKSITKPINAGATDTVIVRFQPLSGYNRLARVEVTTDAIVNANQIILLNGFGGCTEDGFTSNDTLFQGVQLMVGTTDSIAYDTLVVCNTCALPVNVASQFITGINQFDYQIIDSVATTIMPGGCDTAVIAFYPQQGDTAEKSAQFVVRTNARTTGTLTKQLGGRACQRTAITDPVAFSVLLDTALTIQHVSYVTNTGACAMTIDSTTFEGSNDYTLNHAPANATALAPGAKDSVVVTFTSRMPEGVKTAQVVVYSSIPPMTITYNDSSRIPVAVREPGIVVTSYALQQNYPNPFNPSTVIRYSVPSRQHVTVRVTNSLGQTVAVLADEMADAGQYHVTFDASSLPSGSYIYELRAGSTVLARTMTLLK